LPNDKEVMTFESSLDEFSDVFVLGVGYSPSIYRLKWWFCHVFYSHFLVDEDPLIGNAIVFRLEVKWSS
jgi:hypothetical protein